MSPHHTKYIIMQKKIFYTLLCCIISNLCAAQNYTSFDFNNGLWEEEYYHMQHQRSRYNYYIDGDTVINNLTYQKLYRIGELTYSYGTTYASWHSFSTNMGFIREDNNKKVYHLQGNIEERLYDFDIALGDTVSIPTIAYSYDSAIVVAVDSVFICSTMRQRYKLDPIGTQLMHDLYWTEGIGSSHGLIPRYSWFESGVIHVCYSDSTCATPCSNFLSTMKVKSQYSKLATVYPNPSSEKSIIQLNNEATTTKIQVINNIGQVILNKRTNNQEEQLDLSSWPIGLYVIKLEYDQYIETHFLIKE